MNGKYLVYVNIIKNFELSSYNGVIKFLTQQMKKNKIDIEIITSVEKNKTYQIFSFGNSAVEDFTEYNDAKKVLKNLALLISNKAGCKVSTFVHWGNQINAMKNTILKDDDISLIIFGVSINEFNKTDSKSFTSMVKEISNTLMMPILMIPQNITDTQIEHLF